MSYIIHGLHKSAELDEYNEGCVGGGHDDYIDISFTGASIVDCIKECAEFVGVGIDAIELDSCEEIGRIDLCKTETLEGVAPTEEELERWKRDEFDLFYVVYTGILKRIDVVSAVTGKV